MNVQTSPRFWTRGRCLGALSAFAVLAIFAAANAHLIALAVFSQPDCVPHLKTPKQGVATYRAAKPSC